MFGACLWTIWLTRYCDCGDFLFKTVMHHRGEDCLAEFERCSMCVSSQKPCGCLMAAIRTPILNACDGTPNGRVSLGASVMRMGLVC